MLGYHIKKDVRPNLTSKLAHEVRITHDHKCVSLFPQLVTTPTRYKNHLYSFGLLGIIIIKLCLFLISLTIYHNAPLTIMRLAKQISYMGFLFVV